MTSWIFPGLRLATVALSAFLVATSSYATTVKPSSFAELVNQSDYIVRAVVKSTTSERQVKNGRTKIYTRVELEVREVIAGQPPSPLVLVMLGGRVGEEEMRIAGAPQFEVGNEDILFVRDNGKTIYPLTAMMHGRYRVLKEQETGREYVARSNDAPLTDTAEVALAMSDDASPPAPRQARSAAGALTPSQFTQRIRAAVNPTSSRTLQH